MTSAHSLCFEQKYEKYQNFLSENFPCLVVKLLIYLNRHAFVMSSCVSAKSKQDLRGPLTEPMAIVK